MIPEDVIITGFSNPTKEGVTIHLNKATRLKYGKLRAKEFWVSWDHIGTNLFAGYTQKQTVTELDKLRNEK